MLSSMQFFFLLSCVSCIVAHSWIDQIRCDCTDVIGYPRGYKKDSTTPIDDLMTYLISGREPKLNVCSPTQQSSNSNGINFPRLVCPAGATVRFQYMPNGHVEIDMNPNPKQWSIHFLKEEDSTLREDIVTGKNGLNDPLATGLFDDGKCGEKRAPQQPCEGSFVIPKDANLKTNHFVWFWQFNRDENSSGEEYSTCFDIDVTSPTTKCTIARNQESPTMMVLSKAASNVEDKTKTAPPVELKVLSVMTATKECRDKVSDGDIQNGISAFQDDSCPDKVGCWGGNSKCRFCRAGNELIPNVNDHFEHCP